MTCLPGHAAWAGLAACDRRPWSWVALDITVRSEGGAVIAAVTGDIDISTAAQLRERLFELAGAGRHCPPRRQARRQPACRLLPAADPEAAVDDRGGPGSWAWSGSRIVSRSGGRP